MMGNRHFGYLSSPLYVAGSSLLLVAGLSVLLWAPWERRGIDGGVKLRFHCAAGMYRPVAEIIREYQRGYGVTVEPSYAGTGELLANIRTAGGDLFLAADEMSMRAAQKDGLVAETIPVAVLRPVLVVNRKGQDALRSRGRAVTSAADLLRGDLKVMLGTQTTAIGQVTRRALTAAKLWEELERRRQGGGAVSTTGTVNKVAETVSLDDRYAGVVWDAVAAQFPGLEAVRAPEFEGVRETVFIGVLKSSKNPTAALQFARYLTARDRGLEAFRRHHFAPAEGNDVWAERPALRLAVGAMLMPAVADAFKEFEEREGVKIDTAYNGCGVLVSQMKGVKSGEKPGAFPDAYFACDACFLADVRQWFGPGVTISANDIVLVVPQGNPRGVASLSDLKREELRIGVAHPEKSALGRLTVALAKRHGLHRALFEEGWGERVVPADSAHMLINQLRTGAYDVVVAYRSSALSAPPHARQHLQILDIADASARAEQPFAVAADTQHPQLVERLRQALASRQSIDRFRALGFHWLPGTDRE